MKQTALLAIIVGLSAVSMAAIYASDLGQTQLVVATPNSDTIGMFGHIEFVQADSSGNIIGYYQTDNFVTDQGAACAAAMLFDVSEDGGAACGVIGSAVGEFLHIGLGDLAPSTDNSADTTLDNEITDDVGSSRLLEVDAGIVSNAGAGTATVTITTPAPFAFFDAAPLNTTNNIFQAGLFDSASAGQSFAIQNTTSGANPGIDVNDGDTLSVTWTITVG